MSRCHVFVVFCSSMWNQVRPSPVVLSTFTGAGGLDFGLECAGFQIVACVESEKLVRKTISANRPDWPLLDPGNVEQISASLEPGDLGLKRGQLGILAGGPPCQPFSKAAQWTNQGRIGLKDSRSHCLLHLLNIIEQFLPMVVLLENVEGFIRGPNSVASILADALFRINQENGTEYNLDYRIVDAADYGVPQHRRRAILFAVRTGEEFDWPTPTHIKNPVTAREALYDLKNEQLPEARGRWAALLPSIPEGKNYQWHTDRGGGLALFGYRTRYWSFLLKLSKNRPSWTLPAHPGPATGPFHWENRRLSIREMLRLQSFPVGWKIIGSYRQQVKQIGNATPPLLAEIIARQIGRQFFGMKCKSGPKLTIARRVGNGAKLETVLPVPATFLHLRGKHAAHPGSGKGPQPRVPISV